MVGYTIYWSDLLNRGNSDSFKTKLREQSLQLVFIWCISHRLKLALSDALLTTEFADVEILPRMYYKS